MKTLSDRCGQSWEREEGLVSRVSHLEQEVKEWKHQYARARTQIRTLRAASTGSTIRSTDVGGCTKDGPLISHDGRIQDVHVTKFQIAIDELLRSARVEEPSSVVEQMKAVIVCIRHLNQDVSDVTSTATTTITTTGDGANANAARLKAGVCDHANELIMATKTYAASEGIAPISLLDAAASHLTTAVVDLIRSVKIRRTPPTDLEMAEDDEDDDDEDIVGVLRGTASQVWLGENSSRSPFG